MLVLHSHSLVDIFGVCGVLHISSIEVVPCSATVLLDFLPLLWLASSQLGMVASADSRS